MKIRIHLKQKGIQFQAFKSLCIQLATICNSLVGFQIIMDCNLNCIIKNLKTHDT